MGFLNGIAEGEGRLEGTFTSWASVFIILVATAFPIFGLLSEHTLHVWDEARNGLNALEMYRSGNWLVATYAGEPDLWNTKPLLLIWLQAGFMHLLGPGELAIRLPSALSSLLILLVSWHFATFRLRSPFIGFVTPLILATMPCFLRHHAGRTGDYDPLLTLCIILAAISFFAWTEGGSRSRILLFWIFLALACLTKGIGGLLATPVYLLYLAWSGKTSWALRQGAFWLGAACFLLLVGGFYVGREAAEPGFLAAVLDNEIVSRYMAPSETNKSDWWYYLLLFLTRMSSIWGPLAFFGLILVLYKFLNRGRMPSTMVWLSGFTVNSKLDRFLLFGVMFAFVQILVLTISKTKLPWYSLPAMPFLAFLAAEVVNILYRLTARKAGERVAIICLALLFIWPFVEACKYPFDQQKAKSGYQEKLAQLLQQVNRGEAHLPHQDNPQGITIAMHDLFSPYEIYAGFLRIKGKQFSVKEYDALKPGEIILSTHESSLQECLHERYALKLIWEKEDIRMDSVIALNE